MYKQQPWFAVIVQ